MKRETKTLLLVGLCLLLALALAVAWGFRRAHRERELTVHTVRMDAPEGQETGGRTAGSRASAAGGPEVAKPKEEIPGDYFDDAAVVGTEIVTALELYDYDGLLKNADFFPTETVTETGYLKDLEKGSYGKIYLGLGAEELEWNSDAVKAAVTQAVRALKESQPGAVIYLMNVTPVSEYRSQSSTLTTRDRITLFNNMLYDVARDEGVWYLDVYDALSEDGYLPGDVTEDGMTFTPAHYQGWYELLRTRYVPVTEENDGDDPGK